MEERPHGMKIRKTIPSAKRADKKKREQPNDKPMSLHINDAPLCCCDVEGFELPIEPRPALNADPVPGFERNDILVGDRLDPKPPRSGRGGTEPAVVGMPGPDGPEVVGVIIEARKGLAAPPVI